MVSSKIYQHGIESANYIPNCQYKAVTAMLAIPTAVLESLFMLIAMLDYSILRDCPAL